MYDNNNCGDRLAYNTFRRIRGMCYNVINYLMLNNEEIWKLLRYDTPDALSMPDLTLQEKAAMIWDGSEEVENFKVFRGAFLDDAFKYQCSQLRVFISTLNPDNRSVGTCDICLEPIVHNKLINLDNYENRLEVLLQQLLETLNGQEIDGAGKLFFDRNGSMYDLASLNVYNNRNFYGFTIVMSVKVANLNDIV